MSEDNTTQPAKPRRVRIVNDGGPGYATKITDAETGQHIDNVFHIRLVDIDVKDVPRAILWTYTPVVDVVAYADIVDCCKYCGQQKPNATQQGDEYRLKTKINDIDLDFSIEKLRQLQKLQRATSGDYVDPAEALFAFAGWLSSREETTGKLSAHDDASQIAKLVGRFCEAQGWAMDEEHYYEVIRRLRANYPD